MTKPETTGQIVGQVIDCLEELAERVRGDRLREIAVSQMRFYAEWLVEAELDKERAA